MGVRSIPLMLAGALVVGTGASAAAAETAVIIDANWLGGDRFAVTTTTTGCEADASLRWDRDWRFPDPIQGGAVPVGTTSSRTVTVPIPDDWPAVYVELRCDQLGPNHKIEAGAMAQVLDWVPAAVPTSAPASPAATASPMPGASVTPAASGVPAPPAPAWAPSGPLPGPASALATGAAIGTDGAAVMVGMKAFMSGPMVAWVAPDGVTWAPAKVAGAKAGVPLGVVALPAGGFLAFGGGQLWRSSDGAAWKAQKRRLKDATVSAGTVLADGTVLLGGGLGFPMTPAVWSSPDGADFTATELPAVEGADAAIRDLAQDGAGTLLAVAPGGMSPGAFWASSDGGATWTGVPTPDASGTLVGAAALPVGFVAVVNHLAGSIGDGVVWTSSDGVTWTESLRLPQAFLSAPIAIPGGAIVTFGSRQYLTADGVTWTTVDDPALAGPAVPQGGQVAADGQGVVFGWTNGNQGTTAWTAPPAP
jgi:hypothetical protein